MIRRLGRMLGKAVRIALVAGPLALGFLLLALLLEHNSSLELPRPTGPHPIGRLVASWVDSTRSDPFAPPPVRPRELPVWIWYPAEPGEPATAADYLPRAWQAAAERQRPSFLTTFVWRNPARITSHSLANPGIAKTGAPAPVIVFRSGIGAAAVDYTSLAEDLASHGYVVVSADAPYSTWLAIMPDGRAIPKTDQGNPGDAPMPESERARRLDALLEVWVADTRFLLDRLARLNAPSGAFAGRIDLGAVGIAGHSFGGATAAEVCRRDVRCRAGIDLDGALRGGVAGEGVGRPFLYLLSDHAAAVGEDRDIFDRIRSTARRDSATSLIVTLAGAHHFSFSDVPLLQSRILQSLLAGLGGPGGGLAPRAGQAATARYVREFFDVHLRGAPRDPIYSGPLVAGARLEAR